MVERAHPIPHRRRDLLRVAEARDVDVQVAQRAVLPARERRVERAPVEAVELEGRGRAHEERELREARADAGEEGEGGTAAVLAEFGEGDEDLEGLEQGYCGEVEAVGDVT